MMISSHRLKAEENKMQRKLIGKLVIFILTFVAVIFVGVPILVKIIITVSSFKKDNIINTANETAAFFPPVLDPILEATNSSPIILSGYSEKNAKVKIYINGKESNQTVTDTEGKFRISNVQLSEGNNTLVASTLQGDKESTTSSPLNIIYKKSSPTLDISSPKDGDKFSSDDNKARIMIGSTDPGNRVTVNGRQVIVDSTGKFQFTLSLAGGDNVLKVEAIDIAGNKTETELKVTYNP